MRRINYVDDRRLRAVCNVDDCADNASRQEWSERAHGKLLLHYIFATP